MDLDLKNNIILLTGATGGIGRAICLDFLREDASVICLYRNEKKFPELMDWLKKNGIKKPKCYGMACDITDKSSINLSVNKVLKDYGAIDCLVNCAGVVVEMPLAFIEEKQIDKLLNLNLKASILLSQAVLRPMFKKKKGAIINISSAASVKGVRGITVYAATKAGLDAFTRSLATEVGKSNIRVNSVRPGIIDTNMSKRLEKRAKNFIVKNTILGRSGFPTEISKMVVFLASEKTASFITGENFTIDGGLF